MAEIGRTETSATEQQLIASLVQQTLKQEAVLFNLITDYSAFATPGSRQVGIPRRTQFAAADKTENAALTAQELTFSADTISMDKHKAIYAKLEDIARIQSNVNVEAEIISEMASELALQLDNDVYTELKLASAAAPDHRIAFSNATSLGKADIIEARKLLNIQNVPMQDRFMAVNPLHESELLAISDFIEVQKYGNEAQALSNGELGRLYGFTVVMSNVVEDNNCVFFHRGAVGYATQLQPDFKRDEDLASVSTEYLLHWLYGVEVLDGGKRQVLVGTAT